MNKPSPTSWVGLLIAVFMCTACIFMWSCSQDSVVLAGVKLRLITFSGQRPVHVLFHDGAQDTLSPRPTAQATLAYCPAPEETLLVHIEEYHSAVDAYASFTGRGLAPARVPRIVGPRVEKSIFSGKWVFRFASPPHRLPSITAMDSLVRSFPGSAGGLPHEFLSLPLQNRIPASATVQSSEFFGCKVQGTLLNLRYRDELGNWSEGRSLQSVSEGELALLFECLNKSQWQPIELADNPSLWARDGVHLWIGRVEGYLLGVWGMRDSHTLKYAWSAAKRTLGAQ